MAGKVYETVEYEPQDPRGIRRPKTNQVTKDMCNEACGKHAVVWNSPEAFWLPLSVTKQVFQQALTSPELQSKFVKNGREYPWWEKCIVTCDARLIPAWREVRTLLLILSPCHFHHGPFDCPGACGASHSYANASSARDDDYRHFETNEPFKNQAELDSDQLRELKECLRKIIRRDNQCHFEMGDGAPIRGTLVDMAKKDWEKLDKEDFLSRLAGLQGGGRGNVQAKRTG